MSDNASANLGGDVRDRRLAAGITQERLAQFANCSTSSVRLIERGWRPSSDLAARVDRALERAHANPKEVTT
jgi:transcriptional regulator with XRE-family HTH domain